MFGEAIYSPASFDENSWRGRGELARQPFFNIEIKSSAPLVIEMRSSAVIQRTFRDTMLPDP